MSARAASAISCIASARTAFKEAAAAVAEGLAGVRPDLVAVFATAPHAEDADAIVDVVRTELDPDTLIGCVSQGVIGPVREIESGFGAVVWGARLGNAVGVESIHLNGAREDSIIDLLGNDDVTLLFADPLTFDAATLFDTIHRHRLPGRLVGGLVSATQRPGEQALFLDGDVIHGGAVGVSLAGVDVLPAVSQGARPIGPEMVVTAAEGRVVHELASRPALERIEEVFASATPHERALLTRGLLIGAVIDENKPEYGPGDFVVRGIVGTHPKSGAIVVADTMRVGQTVRLHARDPDTATDNLRQALDECRSDLDRTAPSGTLLFSCNGRGAGMFGVNDHDARSVEAALGGGALAGCFCAGEFGPVGKSSFLHGFTATMAIFP